MAAKGSIFDNDFLKLIFNGVSIANLADNSASPLTDLYVGLHTDSPGNDGDQATNEATYSSYVRVAVERSTDGWTVVDNSVSPTSKISFPTATGGSEIITYFSIGTDFSGSGKLLYFGAISPAVTIYNAVTPELTTGSTITEQ